jgi:diguanylate cyclase (GGDEF)-like protein/PAS domain S-box-containing protein
MPPEAHNSMRLTCFYLLFGAVWILLTDNLLDTLGLSSATTAVIQTYKGLAFVLLSSVLIGGLHVREQRARRTLLESLDSSNQQLIRAQRNANLGSWRYAEEFLWSDPALALLGRPTENGISSFAQLLEWLHPADRDAAAQAWQQLLNGADNLLINLRLVPQANQRNSWLMLRGEIDQHGGFCGSVQDISQQQHDQQALYESEQRFRQLFEQTPHIAVQGYNRQRQVIYWNQASCDLYGYTSNEALGQNLEALIVPTQQRTQVAHDIQQMIDGGATIPAAELQLQRKDGQSVWVYSSHLLLRNSQEQVELYCVDIDLSSQKSTRDALNNSEVRYRHLVNQLDEAIFLCDEYLNLKFLNPAWAIISGHAQRSSIGQALTAFLPPVDAENVSRHAEQILNGQLVSWSCECRLRCADERLHWVALQLSRDNNNGLQGSLNDIHAQHQSQELQRARNVVLDQLLAQAPLNTIFNSIANHLQELNPQMLVSIMRLNNNRLYVAAAPSLPSEYCAAIEGIFAERGVGSCGRAVATGQMVIAEDLQTHANWENYRELTRASGLRACWSVPFKNDNDQVLGTFGIYYHQPCLPNDEDIALVTEFTRLAVLALQQQMREAARHEIELRFRTTFENAAIGIAHIAPDGQLLRVNSQLCAGLGYSAEQMTELNINSLGYPDDQALNHSNAEQLLAGSINNFQMETRYLRRDGSLLWSNIYVTLIRHTDSTPHYFISVVEDISLRKQHEQALRQAATVFESTREAVLIVDSRHRILTSNPAYSAITGQSASASVGQRLPLQINSELERNRYRNIWRGLKKQGDWEGELSARRADGSMCPLWLNASLVRDCDPAQPQYVLAFTDLSMFKDSQDRLTHLAHYDPLTDLPNRAFAHERLSHALERAQRHAEEVAVLFLDLDHFKTINDGLGHAVGDELLIAVARRLQKCLRNEDTLARLGGDEFLVILENLKKPEEAAQIARQLIQLFERPLSLSNEREAYLGASIGISYYPTDGLSADELIRNADAALYQAKAEGRNIFRFYTQALTERAQNRISMEGKLRQAIKREEFVLHYQPLVDTLSGKTLGVEALVRWNSPEGMISPADFIPLAEDTGLIVAIGKWVLREACRQAQALHNEGLELKTIAVNLSPRQFRRADLLQQVRDALRDSGLPAQRLELEITEGALMDDIEQTQASLHALKSLGLRLAVDDFGTGYSSLAYLRRFPLDKLKIDQSFMQGVPTDHGDLEIVSTIITLARSLNLTAIAEGVETAEQLQALQTLGCEQSQGYFFSRPLSIEKLREWLINEHSAVN